MSAFDAARALADAKPRVILFDTLMGKGVPFLEQREKNHFIRVDPPEWQQALAILDESPDPTCSPKEPHGMTHRRPRKKPRLTTSAMIASIAAEGQRVKAAPFGKALVELAANRPEIVGMTADLAKYTDLHLFAQAYPDRFYQMGMAEQLLMAAAGGMAKEGFIPFATTYAVFGTRRAYDFIHQVIAEENLNVKICCALPGLTTGYGPSHQATEDIAMMRGIPGPDDRRPLRRARHRAGGAADRRAPGPGLHAPAARQCAAGARRVRLQVRARQGQAAARRRDVLVISSGFMTMRALEVAQRWQADNVDVAVLHCPTIKPLDEATIVEAVRYKDRLVVVAENHSVVGGLGEAVASPLLRLACSRPVSSSPGCPMRSSTPARCRHCTTATASAATPWPRASRTGWAEFGSIGHPS